MMYIDAFPQTDITHLVKGKAFPVDGQTVQLVRKQQPLGLGCRYYYLVNGKLHKKVYKAGDQWVSIDWLKGAGFKHKVQRLSSKRKRQNTAHKLIQKHGGLAFLQIRPKWMREEKWHALRERVCRLMQWDVPEPVEARAGKERGAWKTGTYRRDWSAGSHEHHRVIGGVMSWQKRKREPSNPAVLASWLADQERELQVLNAPKRYYNLRRNKWDLREDPGPQLPEVKASTSQHAPPDFYVDRHDASPKQARGILGWVRSWWS
jgi:hypothetical protein